MPLLPALFIGRLKNIIPPEHLNKALTSFSVPYLPAIRINLLKMTVVDGEAVLKGLGVSVQRHPVAGDIFIVSLSAREQLRDAEFFQDGRMYWQAPSSALPAHVLGVTSGDHVLDMCAAPGSKTTQMAAMMMNEGGITAVEAVKARFYKLKSVVSLTGAKVKCVLADGRRFRPGADLFDKVLVDAPCSSEGRFDTNDKDSMGYWSLRKIREMQHKQKGLLLNAGRCVKPGGTLVYSTCTFAPEENEAVVDWFLRKAAGEFSFEAFDLPGVPRYPSLAASLEGREYKHDLSSCWRVLPDGVFSGFFMAKFLKAGNT